MSPTRTGALEPVTFSYPHYLSAKRSVDARARHPRLWKRVCSFCRETAREQQRSVRILEIGGGVGDLAIALLQALPTCPVDYTIVDVEKENLTAAASNIRNQCPNAAVLEPGAKQIEETTHAQQRIQLQHKDVLSYRDSNVEVERVTPFDLVVGQAVMDILPVQISLEITSSILRPGGVGYFPIHIDGLTEFEPKTDPGLDERISTLYHQSMHRSHSLSGTNVPSDGARCGRDLIVHAASAGMDVEDAASSDWVVHARTTGGGKRQYAEKEDDFLRYMLWFFEDELRGHPELDEASLDAWLSRRHDQIDAGDLILVVHNLDVLVRRKKASYA